MVKEEIKDPDFNNELSKVKERVSILEAEFYQFNMNVEMSVEMIKRSERHFNRLFRTILALGISGMVTILGGLIAILIRLFTSWFGGNLPSNMPAP